MTVYQSYQLFFLNILKCVLAYIQRVQMMISPILRPCSDAIVCFYLFSYINQLQQHVDFFFGQQSEKKESDGRNIIIFSLTSDVEIVK